MSGSSTTRRPGHPAQHHLSAAMSVFAHRLARTSAPSDPERALRWTDRALAYPPIDPNYGPANEHELLELKATLLQRLGRTTDADTIRAEIVHEATTRYRLVLACLADEYKTYRNWYCHDVASVEVWRRALLREIDDAITVGDLDRARHRIVQLGEFSAAEFRPDSSDELAAAIGRLTQLTGGGLSVDSAYRALDRLTRRVLPWVVGAAGGVSLARTLSTLTPVTSLAEATTPGTGASSTATLWTPGLSALDRLFRSDRRVHPIRRDLDAFIDSIEYHQDPVSRPEVDRLTAVALDEIGISLGSEVGSIADANLIWPHRLAASSIEWMTMWAVIRAEWAAVQHADGRAAESETVWERGWRTISGDLFRVIDSVVTRIVASTLDMPSEAAVRMLFTSVPR